MEATRAGLHKAMKGRGLRWEGAGCGMGYCDVSMTTNSCTAAKAAMRRAMTYLKKTNGVPRAKKYYPSAYVWFDDGGRGTLTLKSKCPRR